MGEIAAEIELSRTTTFSNQFITPVAGGIAVGSADRYTPVIKGMVVVSLLGAAAMIGVKRGRAGRVLGETVPGTV